MGSVAASAATAVATAQSVAADRLRHEIEASEEARARWARELHDETLQGLVGPAHAAGLGAPLELARVRRRRRVATRSSRPGARS